MQTLILVNGKVRAIADADKTFERKLPLKGTRSSSARQRTRVSLGSQVAVDGAYGPVHCTILAVSTDKLSFRDEDGTERLTCNILL